MSPGSTIDPRRPDEAGTPNLLYRDPYLASSLLQKSVRRSEPEHARRAAMALYRQRGSAVWRRLLLIAFEDVGIGCPQLLAEIARRASPGALDRTPDNELADIIKAVERLCAAPKDRSADYLFCAAATWPELECTREEIGRSASGQRATILVDPSRSLQERAVSAWYLSGLNVGTEKRLDQGDRKSLFRCFLELGVPGDLVEATRIAAAMSREPMVLMVPLLWLELARDVSEHGPRLCEVPEPEDIGGVPTYAWDKHTRAGKRATGLLASENQQLAELLARFVPDYRAKDAARMAAYYADAVPVRNRFEWSRSRSLELLGRKADMQKVGVDVAGVDQIIDCVEEHLPHLNRIRARVVAQSTGKENGR